MEGTLKDISFAFKPEIDLTGVFSIMLINKNEKLQTVAAAFSQKKNYYGKKITK